MVKAVCVLKGAGDATGTVYFEQEVIVVRIVKTSQNTRIIIFKCAATFGLG